MVQYWHNYIRVGRLLEIMDYIAANVAYRYCTPDREKEIDMNELPFLIATAAIDSIEFYYPISVEIDCSLSGYVSYVGKSSMEVHIDVLQKTGSTERLACSANFVMVARNKATGKAFPVPPINFNG
jgi:acyl-coenzyme A thioesterase 9